MPYQQQTGRIPETWYDRGESEISKLIREGHERDLTTFLQKTARAIMQDMGAFKLLLLQAANTYQCGTRYNPFRLFGNSRALNLQAKLHGTKNNEDIIKALLSATHAYSGNEDSNSLKTIIVKAIINKYSNQPEKDLETIRAQSWDKVHGFYFTIRKLVDELDKLAELNRAVANLSN